VRWGRDDGGEGFGQVERAFGILMGSPFFGMDWWVGGCISVDLGVGFGCSFVTDSWVLC
jgi:hypothetical protein